jgi:predicted GTPase
VNAGKSSLVNALSGTAQALSGAGIHTDSALDVPAAHELHGPLLLTDTVGLRGDARVELGVLTGADLLLWPVALHRADRGADLRALQALRDWAATHPSRSPPPIVFVATHADRLEPSAEWAPPYDTAAGTGRKEQSIAAALAAAKAALAWPEARWVPAALGGVPAWNIEGIHAAIAAARPEAEASRALRLRAVRGTVARAADAARTLRGAGRVLRGEALRGVPDRITRLFPKREG